MSPGSYIAWICEHDCSYTRKSTCFTRFLYCVFLVHCGMVVYLVQQHMSVSPPQGLDSDVMHQRPLGEHLAHTKQLHGEKHLVCFIITLDKEMLPIQLADLTCYPVLGERTNDKIFSHVDPTVQHNLLSGKSERGAHFTNNNSVSIAWNHMMLWRRLADMNETVDMLILEDDCIVTDSVIGLYQSIYKTGVLTDNYILKLVNSNRMKWLGLSELQFVQTFSSPDNFASLANHSVVPRTTEFGLYKCVCKTRQNLFNAGAYILDHKAAVALLQRFLPMQLHIDIYMHYVGCKFSNLFILNQDALLTTGRPSTHQTQLDKSYRIYANFKEQLINVWQSDCHTLL